MVLKVSRFGHPSQPSWGRHHDYNAEGYCLIEQSSSQTETPDASLRRQSPPQCRPYHRPEAITRGEVKELPRGTVTFVFTDIEGSTRCGDHRRGRDERVP